MRLVAKAARGGAKVSEEEREKNVMVDVLEVDMVRQVFSQQETSLDRDQRLGKREEILSDLTQTLF